MGRTGSGRTARADAARAAARRTVVLPVAPAAAPSHLWALALLVAAAAVLPYLNSLAGGFVFDDHGLLQENPYATPGMRAWEWFLRPSIPGSVYRPLTMATYALDAALGFGAPGYHATNVVLHLVATLAAFVLARRLLGRARDAAIAATLFAVHPIHTEAVANLAGRAELLAAAFLLVSLWAVVRYVDEGGADRLGLAFATALAATCSKESAVTLPLLAVIVLAWRAPVRGRRQLVAVATLAAACACYVAARWAVVGGLGTAEPRPWADNPLAHVGTLVRLGTALVVLSDYVGSLTLPLRLSADETFDQVPLVGTAGDLRLLAAIAMLVVLGVAAHRARRRAPAIWYGALFAAGALAITANVLFPIGTIKAERLLYLPSFGWCVAAAGLCALDRRVALPLVTCVVVGFAARTWIRNPDWHDDYRLFTTTAVTSPNSARAHSNAGAVLAQHGELARALDEFTTATRIHAGFVPAQIGRGRVLMLLDRPTEALDAFETARRADPSNIEAHFRIADLELSRGDFAAAATAYRAGLVVAPQNPELLLGLAIALAAQGERDEARALRDRVAARYDLGIPALAPRLALLTQALGE